MGFIKRVKAIFTSKVNTIHGTKAMDCRREILLKHLRLLNQRCGKYGTPEWDRLSKELKACEDELITLERKYFEMQGVGSSYKDQAT